MKNRQMLILIVAFMCGFASSQMKENATTPHHENEKELIHFFSTFFPKLAEENNFNGVVLFANRDSILYLKSFGTANRTTGEPITVHTKFNLASASKMFTTVAIAQLVKQGRLAFSDPIGNFLDTSWIPHDSGQKILVKHLLSHTSGLGQYWDEYDKHFKTIRTIGDYKKIIKTQLSFEPGTKGQYSNTGFILLGAIIEKLTGESYYGYVEKNIFEPLLMKDTKFFDSLSSGIAVGYFVDHDDHDILKDNLHLHGMLGSSAGGCYSTAADILRFMRAIDENRIVDSDTLKFLLTPNRLFKNYGYGFQVQDNWFGHWGGFPGIEAFIMHYPHSGHTIIVFSNYYDSSLPFLKELKKVNKKLGSN